MQTQLYKTKLCRSVELGAPCKFGAYCHYAHHERELQPAPQVSSLNNHEPSVHGTKTDRNRDHTQRKRPASPDRDDRRDGKAPDRGDRNYEKERKCSDKKNSEKRTKKHEKRSSSSSSSASDLDRLAAPHGTTAGGHGLLCLVGFGSGNPSNGLAVESHVTLKHSLVNAPRPAMPKLEPPGVSACATLAQSQHYPKPLQSMRPDEDINHLARERQASPNSIKFAEMLMNYGASIPQLAPTIIQVASIFLETQKINPLIEMKEFLTRLCDVIKSVHCKTEVLDFSFAGLQVVHRKSLETMIASNSRVTRIDLHRGNRDIHTADAA